MQLPTKKGIRIRSFHLSLYLIVPIIFSSFSLLALVIGYRLVLYGLRQGLDVMSLLVVWGAVITGATFCTALLVSWRILSPIEKFVEKAQSIPVVQTRLPKKSPGSGDQLTHFTSVFHEITDFLSEVDARSFFPDIIGESKNMRAVFSQILKVAYTDATVLVTGESGTGKELVAKAVHSHSKRKEKPFIAVNCAAIPEGLLESELFGHEKGAFTGALAQKKGKFELAHGGSIFLDEIGDMPLDTQAKILRALEEGAAERVGGAKTIKFNVRIIAATNKNFQEMIRKEQFREDLFHRLNVFPIHLPALASRREDIPLLVQYFLDKFGKGLEISPEALQLLMTSNLSGNVRELRNVMERAAVLAENEKKILPKHLPGLCMQPAVSPAPTCDQTLSLDEQLEDYEKSMILAALTQTGGVQARAAEYLGIKQRSLWHRIKKYNIDVSSLKT